MDGDRAFGPYVVVGASGILAPLGRVLSAHGVHTVGVSRGDRLGRGEWDERVALDTHDVGAVTDWLAGRQTPFAALIGYDPAVAADCWPLLARGAARVVVVATSSWAEPGSSTGPWVILPAAVVVQLGWALAPGGSRWHTPDEVSTAVAQSLADGPAPRTVLLGSVRPWSARPR